MREKKPCMILTFDTTTDAMNMESECGARGIPGRLIPLPKEISAGCGLSWKISEADYVQYKEAIEAIGITFGDIVALTL